MPKRTTPFLSWEDAQDARHWKLVDAADRPLGRVATQIANLLRGKGKATFSPHVDCGDFVVVVNAERVYLSGRKTTDKVYHRHSEFPGGLRTTTAGTLRSNDPERLFREAVSGMLPKNRLARRLITKLKVYAGAEHPHGAQQPTPVQAEA